MTAKILNDPLRVVCKLLGTTLFSYLHGRPRVFNKKKAKTFLYIICMNLSLKAISFKKCYSVINTIKILPRKENNIKPRKCTKCSVLISIETSQLSLKMHVSENNF